MIQIEEEKIAEMMFDIWHNSNSLKNPVMVGEYIANKLKEAITVTRCCETVKDKYTHTFEVDLNSDKLKEQHCEQMKQIHNATTRLFMYDPKTEKYIELKP